MLIARDILRIWLGTDFANHSTGVFQIISLIALLSSVFWVPYALLQAAGRPDIPAKFDMLELPFFAGLAWLLISRLGIIGAALAAIIRVVVDATLLVWICARLRLVPLRSWVAGRMAITLSMLAGLAVLLAGLSALGLVLPARAALVFVLVLLFSLVAWRHGLQADERQGLRRGLKRLPPFVLVRSVREAR